MNRITTALLIGLLIGPLVTPLRAAAAREMENLNRGVVAICNTYPSVTVYVGWRMLGTEPDSAGYNIYRNGSKINGAPITGSCNYIDTGGNASSTYSVAAVIDGVEQEHSDPVGTWDSAYLGSGQYMGCLEIPLKYRPGYEANDASVGDLDGDGDYELVVKRLYATDNAGAQTTTNFHYIEAYEMDGTLMWEINLGPNNIYPVQGIEINPIVYDFDGNGRAEVALRTCEGNIDGTGVQIGDMDSDGITDYRSSAVDNSGLLWMTQGPEFISIFDGQTGAEIARDSYIERDPIEQWGYDLNLSRNAHRADKCMMTPAYLNGETPSLVICRGIYEKTVLEAWSFRNGTLSRQWTFSSDDWPGYAQQGNHNLTVGDVDGDGRDEIVYASMCVDDDGTGLYTTGLGHGDALHLSDMIPTRPGLEVFAVHEHFPFGATLRDAGTGEIIWRHTAGGDTGRGCAAHVDADHPGYQMWSVDSDGTYDCTTTNKISSNKPNWGNFLIWWDADLQREILDGSGSVSPSPIIDKWNSGTDSPYRLLSLYQYPDNIPSSIYEAKCINGTKSNPCLSGDLIGDWREEAIYPSADNTKLYLYTTCTVANNRIYTLMHDPQYRTAIAWQCNQYNQPPHPSFYIGSGMSNPPTPDIILVEPDNIPPAAPTGLVAAVDDYSVLLDWTDNTEPDLFGYTVYRSTTSDSGYTIIASGLGSSDYIDSSVASSTTYYYVVTASDFHSNESDYSAETNAATGVILVPQANPLAYFRFEEGTAGTAVPAGGSAVIDTAGGDDNMNTATANAAPDYSAFVPVTTIPQTGQTNALSTYYDGSDDLYNAITGPLVTTIYSDFTVEAYVNFSSLNGFQTIVGRDDEWTTDGGVDGNPQALFYLSKHSDNHFRVEVSTVGGDLKAVEGSVYASAGTWYHVAAVGDAASGTLTLYINGQQVGTTTGFDGLYPTATHSWTIGRGQYNGGLADELTGYIDEVRVTDSALQTSQFLNAFNPDTDGDGLLDAWEMDHFGNLGQSGTDDPDGDGDDNETEETNGTPPTISSLPPHIGMMTTNGMLSLNWSSNHVGWRLLYNTNLMTNVWLAVPGSDETNAYETLLNELPSDSLFYQLVYP